MIYRYLACHHTSNTEKVQTKTRTAAEHKKFEKYAFFVALQGQTVEVIKCISGVARVQKLRQRWANFPSTSSPAFPTFSPLSLPFLFFALFVLVSCPFLYRSPLLPPLLPLHFLSLPSLPLSSRPPNKPQILKDRCKFLK